MRDAIKVRHLLETDIPIIVQAFQAIGWEKPTSLYEGYLKESERGERQVWVAFSDDLFAGYITLKRQSLYPSFMEQGIPEIMDLNVLPQFRKQGIGTQLLCTAEQEAAKQHNVVGLGVGLYAGQDGGYGSAQRLYIKQGYVPDGKGVTYNYRPVDPGNTHAVDDDLVLWMTKRV